MSVVNKTRELVAGTISNQLRWMAVGTDPGLTPTTPEMTQLVDELVRVPVTSAVVTGNAVQFTAKFTNLPPCEITEMGLYCTKTGATLGARWLTKALKPTKNNDIEVSWTLQMD